MKQLLVDTGIMAGRFHLFQNTIEQHYQMCTCLQQDRKGTPCRRSSSLTWAPARTPWFHVTLVITTFSSSCSSQISVFSLKRMSVISGNNCFAEAQNIFESHGTTVLSPFLNKAPLPIQKEYSELLVSQSLSIQAYLIQQCEAFRMSRKEIQ